MDDSGLALALDLGSTRFRAVVAEPDGNGGLAILGHASLPARGLARGELSDLPLAAGAIREALETACAQAEAEEVRTVAVSVIGDGVRTLAARGEVALDGGAVRDHHLDLAAERVSSMDIPFDQVLLHCLPVSYSLDDRTGLQNPKGLVGARLGLDAHLVTGSQSAVSAVDRAVSLAGYKVEPMVFGPCATSRYLIEPDEREQGCLLIDIGGEATQYALYYRGRIRQSGVVPVGGNHVTRDLAYGLEVDERRAEEIKRIHGRALRSAVVAQAVGGSGMDQRAEAHVATICEARQQEVLELVANGLQWGISRPALAAGVVLTGGGSRLEGTAELAEQVFALRATTRRAPGDDHGTEPDSWATVLGLVEHAVEAESVAASTSMPHGNDGRIWSNVKRWIGRLV